MNKKLNYYKLYLKWVENDGLMNNDPHGCPRGLCNNIPFGSRKFSTLTKKTEFMDRWLPTIEEWNKLKKEDKSTLFWADGRPRKLMFKYDNHSAQFTSLRQNIILFEAAINKQIP